MEGFINAVTGLVNASDGSLWSIFMLFLMTVALSVIFIFYKKFDWVVAHFPKPAQERTKFERTLIAQQQVKDLLTDEMNKLKADRLSILQFHNGTQDLSGLGFMHASVTFIEMAPGVGVSDNTLATAPVPLSLLGEIVMPMWANPKEPTPIVLDRDDIKSTLLRLRMESNGTELLIAAPIVSLVGSPVGYIVASYLDRDAPRLPNSSAMMRLLGTGQKVAGYLLAVHVKKPGLKWWPNRNA